MFSHPFDYNIANTDYIYEHEKNEVHGAIRWSSSVADQVPKSLIFLVIDDAIGQFNKTPFPVGVTLYLEVDFTENVKRTDNFSVRVGVIKKRQSSKGKTMTTCAIICENDTRIIAKGKALFILDKIAPKISLAPSGNNISQIIRTKKIKKTDHLIYNDMYCKTPNNTIMFYDGQGPPECVHGGVLAIGIMSFLGQEIKMLHVDYRSVTPLRKELQLSRDINTFFLKDDDEKVYCSGTFE